MVDSIFWWYDHGDGLNFIEVFCTVKQGKKFNDSFLILPGLANFTSIHIYLNQMMSALDLNKPQKRIARQIIETGLQREYEAGIIKLDKIISRWKNKKIDNRDAYMKIYSSLTWHDKHIGRRYNKMTGSWYLYIIAAQLADEVITVDELNDFPEDIREKIFLLSGMDE